MSNIKAFVTTTLGADANGNAQYECAYIFSSPPHPGMINGGVVLPLDPNQTETEVNAAIQQAVADKMNFETSNEFNFTPDDVRGGRI